MFGSGLMMVRYFEQVVECALSWVRVELGSGVRTALDAFPTFSQRRVAPLMTYFGQCAPVAAKDTSPSALAISDRGYS